ncbi:MAG TPA: ROK family protein [Pyrinomonadaceae bacterium]|nr:ROK family protein [Pyrinomonadaceae bacterium]
MSDESATRLILSVDLGGTHLRAALIDETGKIQSQLKRATPISDKANCIVDALVKAAQELTLSQINAIVGASVVVPGTVDKSNKIVVQAPNLPSLDHFGLKHALEERLQIPVFLENDANAAAVGEMWLGAARGARNVICITLGTGVGGGILLEGKLWRGTEGSAGELGHTTVDPFRGPQCKCGNIGCLEMFASATAIVRMTRESLSSYPNTIVRDRGLTAREVYDAAKLGDELALKIFERVGDYLGVGLVNLINIVGPEVIVIGGGVANAWDVFEPPMREQIRKRAFPSLAQDIQIKPAECGDNAGLLGAAHLALNLPRIERMHAD